MTRSIFYKSMAIWHISLSTAFAAAAGDTNGQAPGAAVSDAARQAMTDIHDIKPALPVGPDLQWLYWALALLALAALAILAWRLWQGLRKPQKTPAAPPPPAPDAEAYQLLDALAADGNLNPKLFYFRLSAIVRRYIERRYHIAAAEMTTEELLPRVDRLPLGAEMAHALKDFCRFTDPIKFAGAGADQQRMAQDLVFARDFVHRTTAAVEAAARAAAGPPTAPAALTATNPLLPGNGEKQTI